MTPAWDLKAQRPITPTEAALGFAEMLAHAELTGGGRSGCCARGLCLTHLSEADTLATHSTVLFPTSVAHVPNASDQSLVAAVTQAAMFQGIRVLGLDPEVFAA